MAVSQDILSNSIVLDTTSSQYLTLKRDFIRRYEIHKGKNIERLRSSFKDKIGKEIVKDYEESSELLVKLIKDNQYIFNIEINKLVEEILSNFKNKDLPKTDETLFLISKDLSLNAFCYSDGILIINAGVFIWLQNADQLASVLAHELAHHSLNHYNKFQYELLMTQTSIEKKDEIKKIQNASQNKSKLALTALRSQLYNQAKMQRKNEFEADSLGFLYYASTGYKPNEYIKGMELMMKYDTLPYMDLDSSTYYTLYDLPVQKLKRSWFEGEDFSNYYYVDQDSDFNEDSLSSHPSLEIRIKKLKNFKTLGDSLTLINQYQQFDEIAILIESEFYPILYFNESFGAALYGIMLALERSPQSLFHKQWLGLLFKKIYEARKSYTLNRYVESVDMRDKNLSYQKFLSFIWQLNLKEIKTIADHYQNP